MAKFKATFEGYPEDLVRVVGMAMNGFIRKMAEENDAKAVRSTFLRPETATPEWLLDHITEQVAIALFQRPTEKRSINELARRVLEEYRDEIEDWIEENKVNLAEIGFLFPDAQAEASATRVKPSMMMPPPATPAVPAKPAPPAGITGFICRRGRK
jgi:hypothetical protein